MNEGRHPYSSPYKIPIIMPITHSSREVTSDMVKEIGILTSSKSKEIGILTSSKSKDPNVHISIRILHPDSRHHGMQDASSLYSV